MSSGTTIKSVTINCIGETHRVGGPYIDGSPSHGVIARIERVSGGYRVYNDQEGHTFYAEHLVGLDSIVEE